VRCERLHRRRHPTPFFIYAYHITHRINLRQSRAVSRVHAQARKRASFRLEHHGRLASEARVAQRRTRAPRRSTSSTTDDLVDDLAECPITHTGRPLPSI
jgi:hypothetical protein